MAEALDVEIARVKAAVKRAEAELDDLKEVARGGCCPSCVLGRQYTKPADAQERRLAWLAILLEKRGATGDVGLARAIRMSAWP